MSTTELLGVEKNSASHMTVGQAAEFLGVSAATLRNWDRSGWLKPSRHPKNGYRIYQREELESLLDRNARSTSPLGWQDCVHGEHFVQFYEDDAFLIDSVAGYVGTGLARGESCLLIATPEHLGAIQRLLGARGVDVKLAQDDGRYVALDARATLEAFMNDRLPDPARFQEVIGSAAKRLLAMGRPLRAFGEMVALLWKESKQDAAIELERLWNDLIAQHPLTLFCAYPLNGFHSAEHAHGFADICSKHTRTVPAESYSRLTTPAQRMGEISRLQQKAQALEAEVASRQAVERRLLESQQWLWAVLETTPDCVKIVAPDGALLYMNPRGLAMIQAQELSRVQGTSVFSLIAPEHRKQWMENHQRICQGEKLSWDFQIIGLEGRRIWMESHAVPLVMPDGRVCHLAVTREITERKQAEAERQHLLESERAARSEAERTSRMKDEFLATLSHELRTPLNAIVGWASLLQESPENPQSLREGLEIIHRNAKAQTQMISDLLDMSRIISGKLRLEMRKTDLGPIIQGAVESIRLAARAKEIHLQLQLPSQMPAVNCDAARLQQVLLNLLSNAIKFTSGHGQVRVIVEQGDADVRIRVSDSGEGIAPEFLPYVFDRFRQADASTTRRHGGLGLGLAIVRQLVELHGGSISAHSEGCGKGATFTIQIPVPHGTPRVNGDGPWASERSTVQSNGEQIDLTGVRVLLVEDEEDARTLSARVLSERGATVVTAGSAADALRNFESNPPDVLVSDIGMPHEDGYWLIRQVRQLNADRARDVPALAVTAYARGEDRQWAIAAGYQLHLSKPLDPMQLVIRVAELAGRIAVVS